MRFDIFSDAHLEFFHRYTDEAFQAYWKAVFADQTADVLLLAGDTSPDIGRPSARTAWFFREAVKRWSRVFCVLGNHDYWGNVVPYTEVKMRAAALYPEVTFLENETADLGEAVLFGATWWTKVPEAEQFYIQRYMRDYSHTPSPEGAPVFSPAVTSRLHEESRAALQNVLKHMAKPVVVLTHHAPSFSSSRWPDARSALGFCSADDDLMLDYANLRFWVHGHVHNPADYNRGATRVLCRPHGYIDYERSRAERFHPAAVNVVL